MRERRAVCLFLAVAAGALSARAVSVASVESVYRRGLGITDKPAEDLPGRLEAYEEAGARAPHVFEYRLRSAQIRLGRAAGGGAGAAADVERALQHAQAAVAAHPLDAVARSVLADALLLSGRADEARTEATRALRLGPMHPGAQGAVARLGLDTWAVRGDVAFLRLALDAGALLDASDPAAEGRQARRRAERACARRPGGALPDLLEAAGGDAGRLRVAAAWLERADPVGATVLLDAAERARPGDPR